MAEFITEKIETTVDFIAWSVAKMEREKRPISAESVSGNMCQVMAEQFHNRLKYYRSLLPKNRPGVRRPSLTKVVNG